MGRRRGCPDSPGSRGKLEHQQETRCRGEARRGPEAVLSSQLEVGRGLLGMWMWPCGVTKMRITVTKTVMKVFLESGVLQATQRRWWGS